MYRLSFVDDVNATMTAAELDCLMVEEMAAVSLIDLTEIPQDRVYHVLLASLALNANLVEALADERGRPAWSTWLAVRTELVEHSEVGP